MNIRGALALYGNRNPFCTAESIKWSNYSAFFGGLVVRLLDFKRPSARAKLAHAGLRSFIQSDAYPCVGARSVVNRSTYRFGYYGSLTSAEGAFGLARDLCAFVAERQAFSQQFSSFMAIFDDEALDESRFEEAMWRLLIELNGLDSQFFTYAASANSDPADPKYAFSFAETAFFVVGLHPQASRTARRYAYPTLVFNPHDQFNILRAEGRWSKFQSAIRARELKLQGSLNPNLSEFGEVSEARQYSGKPVTEKWACPFKKN
jgi:FPC/CPF motif-containing protein YcgG